MKIETQETAGSPVIKMSIATLLDREEPYGPHLIIASAIAADDGHPELLYMIDGAHKERCRALNKEEARRPRVATINGWGVLDEDDPALAVREIGSSYDLSDTALDDVQHGAAILLGVAKDIRERAEKECRDPAWDGLADFVDKVVERAKTWAE